MEKDVQELVSLSCKMNDIVESTSHCKYISVEMFADMLKLQDALLETIKNHETIETNRA